jgi:MOSC domain-containing protein YiiM
VTRPAAPSEPTAAPGSVLAVHLSEAHVFSKSARLGITLLAGRGVEGDTHAGATVQHRSRVARNPDQPNLRQVHLIHHELHRDLVAAGFPVGPGDMGENITTIGVDLLGLATDSVLHIGSTALVRVTGLRNPCVQLDRFLPGLMAACLGRDADGALVRKAGVMGVVLRSGQVVAGDTIRVQPPDGHPVPLAPV